MSPTNGTEFYLFKGCLNTHPATLQLYVEALNPYFPDSAPSQLEAGISRLKKQGIISLANPSLSSYIYRLHPSWPRIDSFNLSNGKTSWETLSKCFLSYYRVATEQMHLRINEAQVADKHEIVYVLHLERFNIDRAIRLARGSR